MKKLFQSQNFFFNFSMYIHIQQYTVSPYLPSQSLPALGGRVFFLLVDGVCEALGRAPCRACTEIYHIPEVSDLIEISKTNR